MSVLACQGIVLYCIVITAALSSSSSVTSTLLSSCKDFKVIQDLATAFSALVMSFKSCLLILFVSHFILHS